MPDLGGPLGPLQALLPSLTKVSGCKDMLPISSPPPHQPVASGRAPSTCPSWSPPSGPAGILKKKCLPTISEKSSLSGHRPSKAPRLPGALSQRGQPVGPPALPPAESPGAAEWGHAYCHEHQGGTVDEDSSGSE